MSRPYEVRVDPDRLPGGTLLGILVAAVLITGACAATVQLWLPSIPLQSSGGVEGAPKFVGPLEVTLLPSSNTGMQAREVQREQLNHYSWVDRQRGIVAIPIGRAMQIIAERQQR